MGGADLPAELEALVAAGPEHDPPGPGGRAPGRLTSLQSEGQKLSSNCADLQKISTQIPSVQSPTDIDAEESSFESQFNALAASSGVTLAQFSGFTPASTDRPPADHGRRDHVGRPAGASTPAGVTAVPTTLTVQGDFGQIMSFVNGLDSFPRLFVIQKFVLGLRTGRTASSGSTVAAPRHQAAGALGGRPARRARRCGWAGRRRRVGRSLQPGDHRLDLLHVDAQRPGRLHQGHRPGRSTRPAPPVPVGRMPAQATD